MIGKFEEKDFMCQVFESLMDFTPKKMARLRGYLGEELFNMYFKYGQELISKYQNFRMATDIFKKCKAIGVKLGMKNLDVVEDKIRDINSKFEFRNYENDGFMDQPRQQEKTNMKTYVLMKKGDSCVRES